MRILKVAAMVVALAALAAVAGAVEVGEVLSNSMAPTLRATPAGNDRILVERLSCALRGPRRWEVVTFPDPRGGGKTLIKRVVGLAGERLAIRDGELRVDGQVPARPAGLEGIRYRALGPGEWVVPPGCCFVLGDNSGSSVDSRAFGPVSIASIDGRMIARLGR